MFFNLFTFFNPPQATQQSYHWKAKIKNLLWSYWYMYLVLLVCVLFLLRPLDYLVTDILGFPSILNGMHQSSERIAGLSFWFVVIIGPLIEEIYFAFF